MRHAHRLHSAVSFALLVLLGGCSASDPTHSTDATCPEQAEQALTNAASSESYLGLDATELRAIVQIVDTATQQELCSGTFVAPGWVLSAAHCLEILAPEILITGDSTPTPFVAPVQRSVQNPNLDLVLLAVTLPPDVASSLAPIAVVASGAPPLVVGDTIEIAGYGVTETGSANALRFLAESVTTINESTITVSGFGKSGACAGDSGGPLLLRAPGGSPSIAGVLSIGSATCLDSDSYVRLDAVSDWISQTAGPLGSSERACGGITAQGRCLYGSAIWCDGTELSAMPCTNGQACGWDPSNAGFRCVDPAQDACAGIDSVGACRGDAALRCQNGMLAIESCTPCATCRVDGRSGQPTCVSSP